ncbi:hypothetical protein RE428_42370 [Marinobacter nanhaiticus D15-8W]|uniref:Transcriptional regulator n=1 Tax=Marinobacter nanhaiticus D15-8W TaxID=626887 RepID=N6WXV9_9GAMM|nr:nucleotidyltransferase domain-containing protein [Marinobacter nanhaiticus]ENO15922.1 transcriptional regulator [Marinobacter nanhaiticus D15-8W]BES73219.1 hypothetical protein RE428_42370 [Marinobacter nanhaiticus D15-8W]
MNAPQLSQRTSLADALFAGTRQKVLRILFLHPEETFSIAELIEQAGAGSGAVQREISRLVDSGLVAVTMDRRQKRYTANQKAPVYPELASLVAKTLGPVQQVERALDPIEDQLVLALIYGSVARNSDHADSDIDLMIVSDSLTLEDVFNVLEPVEASLMRTINPTLYKCDEFERRRAEDNPFLRKVLGGQYILLKGIIDEQTGIGQPGQNSQTPH